MKKESISKLFCEHPETTTEKHIKTIAGVYIIAHFAAIILFSFLKDAFRIGGAMTKLLPALLLFGELIGLILYSCCLQLCYMRNGEFWKRIGISFWAVSLAGTFVALYTGSHFNHHIKLSEAFIPSC